jgi:FlaA1/EpsC-like NDP-sugar epimerase
VPLSVIVIDAMLAFFGVLGMRLLRRALFEYREKRSRSSQAVGVPKSRALLVGAGRAGVLAAREIVGQDDMGLEVEGFVDDDPVKRGAQIQGFRVLGTIDDLPRLVRERRIDQVVIHDRTDHSPQDPAHHRDLPADPRQVARCAGPLRDPARQGADDAHPHCPG